MSKRYRMRDSILLIVLALASIAAFARHHARVQAEYALAARKQAEQERRSAEDKRTGELANALNRAGREGDVETFAALITKVDKITAHNAVQNAVQHGQTAILKQWYEQDWPPHVAAGSSRADKWLLPAAGSQNPQTVKFLLDRGANANIKAADMTPLAYASCQPNTAVVQMLLDAGADVDALVNLPDTSLYSTQWTPLMFAAKAGNADVVKLLLAHHARITTKSERGQTALSLAKQFHHPDVVQILEAHCAKE